MKSVLLSLISTNKGWIVRQVLKYVAVGSTAATTWLVAKGYDALANSLTKLGGAMKSLNVKSSQELGNLTAGLLKGKAPSAVSVNNNMTQNRVQMAEMKRVKKEEQNKKEDEAKKPSELQMLVKLYNKHFYKIYLI